MTRKTAVNAVKIMHLLIIINITSIICEALFWFIFNFDINITFCQKHNI